MRAVNDYGEETQGKNENAVRSFIMSEMARRELDLQLDEFPGTETIFNLPTPQTYGKHWKRFCEDNGLRHVSPYELRHTFVSVVKRLPAGEIKPLVGHSEDMDTFGVYGHVMDGEGEQLAESVNGLFERILAAEK